MTFNRRLLLYCAAGVIVCVVARVALLFCFFTYQLIGKYIYLPFLWLSSWPNMLFQPFFPRTLPSWLEGLGWPINCFVSLVGWIIVSVIAALLVHIIVLLRQRTKV